MSAPEKQPDAPEEPPPFLSSWRNVYVLVAGELLVLVVAFYALTWWAA